MIEILRPIGVRSLVILSFYYYSLESDDSISECNHSPSSYQGLHIMFTGRCRRTSECLPDDVGVVTFNEVMF